MQIIIWFGNNFSLKMEKCSCTMPLSCLKCFAQYLSIHSLKPQTVSVVIALKVSLNQKKFPILKSVSLVIGLLTFWEICGIFLEVFQKLCVWVLFKFFPGNFLESVSLGMYLPKTSLPEVSQQLSRIFFVHFLEELRIPKVLVKLTDL